MAYRLSTILLGVLIAVLAGCAGKPNLPAQPQPGEKQGVNVLVDAYKIGIGDQVQVTVWKNKELSVAEPVRPDGKIALPLIGDVMAAGREPEKLAAVIKEKLSTYVKNPNVTVILVGLKGHEFLSRIRVTGSVTKNTSMTYQQGMTVMDAVIEAGSVDLYADSNRTKLYRRTAEGNVTYDIRLKDILEKGDMSTNIPLMPGDVITVPERAF